MNEFLVEMERKSACIILTIMSFSCRSFAAVGVDPAVMGVGPAVAIPAAVKAAGLQLDDIDLFEINEVVCLNDCLYNLVVKLMRVRAF